MSDRGESGGSLCSGGRGARVGAAVLGAVVTQTLQVRLLGRVEVLVDGHPVDVPGRRPQALLAVLALSAGEPVLAESLYERVWGHDQPGDVRANLYTCVRRLRKALGEQTIVNDGGRYTLRVEPDGVDAIRFIRLLDMSRAVGADSERLLREALALWRGRPFGGESYSDWLAEEESRRLTERWLAAVQQRIDLDLAAGRDDGLVEELEQLTSAYPLREPLWGRYLTALGRMGRPADALAAYERIRVRLVDELGIDPSPELRALYADLLRADSAAGPGATPAPTVVPRQLPSDIAAFTGRDAAVTELDGLLGDESAGQERPAVIVVLHGMGGVGKTALAVHWAHRVAPRFFPDGQLFVNLRGFGPGEPMDVAAALEVLLRGLEVPAERIPSDVAARSALLRSTVAGRRLLVVLDNARDAEQVRPLVPGAGCLVLVTSRSRLRGLVARDGALDIGVHVMTAPEAIGLLRDRLRHRPSTADPTTDEALSELARLCGYLPLALTIAAVRSGGYAGTHLAELVTELRAEHARLDAFADADDPLADVRAVVAWSYQTLDPEAARMLRVLSVCPTHDFSLAAAAALAEATVPQTRRLLDRLADASLLTVGDGGRFYLHDLVRAFAAEAADSEPGSVGEARDRLYYWCLDTATKAGVRLEPGMLIPHPADRAAVGPVQEFVDDQAAIRWLDQESDFLAAVARAAIDSCPWATVGIVYMMWNQFMRQRSDAVELQEAAVSASRTLGDPVTEGTTRHLVGLIHMVRMEYAAAEAAFNQALPLFEATEYVPGQSRALNNLGIVLRSTGRAALAVKCHERALRLAVGQELDEAAVLNNLALALTSVGQHDRAVACARRAVLSRVGSSTVDYLSALDTLGETLHGRGDDEEAVECFSQALQLVSSVDLPQFEAIILAHLGRSLRTLTRADEARSAIRRAIALMDEHLLVDNFDLTRTELVELLARMPLDAEK